MSVAVRYPILKTRAELAEILGMSRNTVRDMELEGCPFPAGRCTVEWALEWLKSHPQFRARHRPAKPKAPRAGSPSGSGKHR
jgi:hypothetical protein